MLFPRSAKQLVEWHFPAQTRLCLGDTHGDLLSKCFQSPRAIVIALFEESESDLDHLGTRSVVSRRNLLGDELRSLVSARLPWASI